MSDEIISLDNDSFLNSLDSSSFTNMWASRNSKHHTHFWRRSPSVGFQFLINNLVKYRVPFRCNIQSAVFAKQWLNFLECLFRLCLLWCSQFCVQFAVVMISVLFHLSLLLIQGTISSFSSKKTRLWEYVYTVSHLHSWCTYYTIVWLCFSEATCLSWQEAVKIH